MRISVRVNFQCFLSVKLFKLIDGEMLHVILVDFLGDYLDDVDLGALLKCQEVLLGGWFLRLGTREQGGVVELVLLGHFFSQEVSMDSNLIIGLLNFF